MTTIHTKFILIGLFVSSRMSWNLRQSFANATPYQAAFERRSLCMAWWLMIRISAQELEDRRWREWPPKGIFHSPTNDNWPNDQWYESGGQQREPGVKTRGDMSGKQVNSTFSFSLSTDTRSVPWRSVGSRDFAYGREGSKRFAGEIKLVSGLQIRVCSLLHIL